MIINFYLTRISDGGLAEIQASTFAMWDHAPRFSEWLSITISNEQERRLISHATPIEPTPPTIDIEKWTGADLSDALVVATVNTYHTRRFQSAAFADAVCKVVLANPLLTPKKITENTHKRGSTKWHLLKKTKRQNQK